MTQQDDLIALKVQIGFKMLFISFCCDVF